MSACEIHKRTKAIRRQVVVLLFFKTTTYSRWIESEYVNYGDENILGFIFLK